MSEDTSWIKTTCSYCGSANGGHTLACWSLQKSADEGDPDIKRSGWERRQIPFTQPVNASPAGAGTTTSSPSTLKSE